MSLEEETPIEYDNYEDLADLARCDEAEGAMETRDIATLIVRTVTVFLTILGGVWLCVRIKQRRRGSWLEALLIISIQILWQVLAWYRRHIDVHWFYLFTCGTVDSETSRKVYIYFENLLHALALYTGVVVVGRLGSLVGILLYILTGMSILAPLVYSVIILLLDLHISPSLRLYQTTLIGIAAFKMVILNLVPLGLLICWTLSQCRQAVSQKLGTNKRKSSREVASNIITAMLIIFHLISLAQLVVYIISRSTENINLRIKLIDYDLGLTEASYLLACLALPWSWFLGLVIPLHDTNTGQLDMNLKLAKQNKHRNVIKYQKETSAVATPPTSPMKFSPEVTSSPSIHSMTGSLTKTPADISTRPNMNPTPLTRVPPPPAGDPKEKRRSYLEAVSSSNLHVLEDAPPRQSKSADPLWLPSGKPIEL